MAGTGLTCRESAILLLLLKRYADTRKPVPSSHLHEIYGENLSSSSLRALLFDLEKKGFLSKEHVSSGRVPTDLAYNYFASTVLKGLSLIDARNSTRRSPEGGADLSEMARGFAHGISERHRSVAFATAPSFMEAKLQLCEMYPMAPGRIALFCVSSGGRLYERVLDSRHVYTYEHLRTFSNYITQNYRGRTFREIRAHLKSQLVRDREKVAGWVLEALSLLAPAVERIPSEADLFLSGLQWLVDVPEIAADHPSLKLLMETVERKEMLLGLLDSVMEEGRDRAVVLGSDMPAALASPSLALMAFSYGTAACGRGMVGMIGYKAMRYDEAIPNLFSSAVMLTEASLNLSLTGGKELA